MKNGYTLLELLAVLAITGFIFGLGYAGFRAYTQRQQVDGVARGILGDLRLAQEQAIAGKKPEGCTVLNGYKFLVSGTGYEVSAWCSDAISSSDISVKAVSIPANITIIPPSVNPIIFKSIGQGTNIPAGTSITVSATNASINYTHSVSVGSGGDIR